MSNAYLTLKTRQQEEFNAFPIEFAFNMKQFEEAMTALGLTPKDTDKVYKIPGGGLIRKTDSEALLTMSRKHADEHAAARAADTNGTGFIYDMFEYELANHEYSYTYDPEPALNTLGLTLEEVEADPIMADAFKRAKAAQFKTAK
ncbi:MAG: hypothetical protein BWX70_01523 [Verrucomicrobia bacterium ADurb.Bin070]|nr:MAG: hypothetical protein BWX70_01523 [Verrucomicrobia bacterium ADurb.Bin070]